MIVVKSSLTGLIDKFGEFRIARLDNPYLVGKYKLVEYVPLYEMPDEKKQGHRCKGGGYDKQDFSPVPFHAKAFLKPCR